MKIITNNHHREFIYGDELPIEAIKEFSDIQDFQDMTYIYYKGQYMLHEFLPIPDSLRRENPELDKWSGYMSDSFFSGLLIRYSEDMETYQIATYIT